MIEARHERVSALRCAYCFDSLHSQAVAYCPRCYTPHHTLCFNEAGCTVLGCDARAESSTPPPQRPYRGLGKHLARAAALALLVLWLGASTATRLPTYEGGSLT